MSENVLSRPSVSSMEILDKTPALIYVYDYISRTNIFLSKGLYATIGYSAAEVAAMGASVREKLYHPEDFGVAVKHDRHIRALKEEEIYTYTFRLRCGDGKFRWFVSRVKGYEWDEDGQMIQSIGLCAKLLAQDDLHTRLAAEELRFRAIYNSTTDLNLFVDPAFNLLAINHTALRYVKKYYNYTLHAGDPVLHILPPRWSVQLRRCLQMAILGQNSDLQLSYQTDTNTTITFRFRFFPVRADSDEIVGVNVNASNISRLSAVTLKAEAQTKQLRQIAQLNAHEIRRPLTNILGLIHLIGLEFPGGQLPDHLTTMLGALKQSGEELDHVIRTIVATATANEMMG